LRSGLGISDVNMSIIAKPKIIAAVMLFLHYLAKPLDLTKGSVRHSE
jgi:hypothetical protein